MILLFFDNNLYYDLYNDEQYEEMKNNLELKKAYLQKLKKKSFKTKRVLHEISFVEQDINNASIAIKDYETKKRNIKKKKDATLFVINEKIAGTYFRSADEINGAINFIDNDCALERFEGLKNKDIKEDFCGKVYKYADFFTRDFSLIPEPDNEYDENAIKVMVDKFHVGYLSRKTAKTVATLMSLENKKISFDGLLTIVGGPYKMLDYYEDKVITKRDDFNFKLHCSIIDSEKFNK